MNISDGERQRMDAVEIPDDPAVVVAWARTLSAKSCVGICGNPNACIVSEYLLAKYPEFEFETQPDNRNAKKGYITLHPLTPLEHDDEVLVLYGEARQVTMSPALNNFAVTFDDMPTTEDMGDYGQRAMSAGEFLRSYGGVRRARS